MLPAKKIISFDLDGTLTVSKRPITPEMAALVKELIKNKIVVVISGGSFNQFKTQFFVPFEHDNSLVPYLDNLILLPTSGSQTYKYDKTKKEWQLTDKEPFPEDVKNRAKNLLAGIISNSSNYEIPPNPQGEIVEDRDTQLTFSALGQLAPIEEKMLWDPDQRKRKKIVAELEPKLPEVTLLINSVSSIDILSKGFNKAVGIEKLLRKLNLAKTDIVFLGDGLFPGGNDYSVHEAGIETIKVSGPEETASIIKGWIG